MAQKTRLDQAVVERGLAVSREQARRLILAGEVRVGESVSDKPGTRVAADAEISVRERPRYVSRGGQKLEGALDAFGIDVRGRVCLDGGASTGGFTDCLLQRGARHVFAFDVGTNQLAWSIRSDPRVTAREKFNLRGLSRADVPAPVDFIALDVSFISLTLVLAPCFDVLASDGDLVCLIKPQFEVGREDVGKGGIVRDPSLHARAVEKIRTFAEETLAKAWRGCVTSPLQGADGNIEFLAWMRHKATESRGPEGPGAAERA